MRTNDTHHDLPQQCPTTHTPWPRFATTPISTTRQRDSPPSQQPQHDHPWLQQHHNATRGWHDEERWRDEGDLRRRDDPDVPPVPPLRGVFYFFFDSLLAPRFLHMGVSLTTFIPPPRVLRGEGYFFFTLVDLPPRNLHFFLLINCIRMKSIIIYLCVYVINCLGKELYSKMEVCCT